LLKDDDNVLNIYMKSDLNVRAKRAMLTSECFSKDKLKLLINEKDKTSQSIIKKAW